MNECYQIPMAGKDFLTYYFGIFAFSIIVVYFVIWEKARDIGRFYGKLECKNAFRRWLKKQKETGRLSWKS